MLDTKSTKNKTRYHPYKAQSHQVEWMMRADQAGIVAGYLVEWRETQAVEFFQVTERDWNVSHALVQGMGSCRMTDFMTLEELLHQMMKLRPTRTYEKPRGRSPMVV